MSRATRRTRIAVLLAVLLTSTFVACLFPDYEITSKSVCTSDSTVSRCFQGLDGGWQLVRLFDVDAGCPTTLDGGSSLVGVYYESTIKDAATDCSDCTCTGTASCTLTEVHLTSGGCEGGVACVAPDAAKHSTPECASIANTDACDSVSVEVVAGNGDCSPQGGEVRNQDQAHAFCYVGEQGLGCAPGSFCTDTHACYIRQGDQLGCPVAGFEARFVYPLGDVGRSCSPCACTPSCDGSVFFHTSNNSVCDAALCETSGKETPIDECDTVNTFNTAVRLCPTPNCLASQVVGNSAEVGEPLVLCCPKE